MGIAPVKGKNVTFSIGWCNLSFDRGLGQKFGIERSVPWPGVGTLWSHCSTTRQMAQYQIEWRGLGGPFGWTAKIE
jgi:hypothetical protein